MSNTQTANRKKNKNKNKNKKKQESIPGYQFPSNLNSHREAFLSPKLTERPPTPNAIKTVLETRSNEPSQLEGVVYIYDA